MKSESTLTLSDFKPRWYQKRLIHALFKEKKRKALLVWCRRAGKDMIAWQVAIWMALAKKSIVYYIFPTQRQARDAIWAGITMDGKSFMDFIPQHLIYKRNESRMEILFTNGSILALKGSTNYDSLRGSNPKVVIFSEYAYCDQRVYPEIIHPIIEAQMGTVIFISTPFGKNHFYNLYEVAKATPESWYVDYLTVEDTGHIDIDKLKEDVANGIISEDQMLAEYYCKWDRGVTGSIFGKYLHKIRLDDRISAVPYESAHPVYTAWDLGWDDATAIILFQVIGNTVRIIDSYENNRKPLDHYVRFLQDQEYVYGKHFLPHDGRNHELIAGISRERKLKELGLSIQVLPRSRIIDRIEEARCMFSRLWIDDRKCANLITSLENYRREYDNVLERYKESPVHDKFSHFADAFTYAALALPHCRRGMTQEDADKLREKALWKQQGRNGTFGGNMF